MPFDDLLLYRIITNDPHLTKLDLTRKCLNEFEIHRLIKALEKNNTITSINLTSNKIYQFTVCSFLDFSRMLRSSQVYKLDLSLNQLYRLNDEEGNEGLSFLIECLKITKILSLNLTGNYLYKLTYDDWVAFTDSLKKTPIIKLGLGSNQLYRLSKKCLAFIFKNLSPKITQLDLIANGLNNFNENELSEIIGSLKESSVNFLDLRYNQFYENPESLKGIALGLEKTKVTNINLSQNQLSAFNKEEIQRFIELLGQTQVNTLSLQKNGFETTHLEGILEGLKHNTQLTTIGLENDDSYLHQKIRAKLEFNRKVKLLYTKDLIPSPKASLSPRFNAPSFLLSDPPLLEVREKNKGEKDRDKELGTNKRASRIEIEMSPYPDHRLKECEKGKSERLIRRQVKACKIMDKLQCRDRALQSWFIPINRDVP